MRRQAVLLAGAVPLLVLAAFQRGKPPEDPPMPVRYREGITHGFLALRSDAGVLLAHGDLLQTAHGDTVEARLVFRFKDGSLLDEAVTYTQHDVFTMRGYHLVQRGPAFQNDTEVWMERAGGTYRVKSKSHEDNEEKSAEGKLDLAPDTYNGLVLTVLKNIPRGSGGSIHMVAFLPSPKVVRVEIQRAGEHKVLLGDQPRSAFHLVLKPRLGTFTRLFAKLLGRFPPDNHAWILNDEVPTFVRFVGPLYPQGPIWQIQQTTLEWPDGETPKHNGPAR